MKSTIAATVLVAAGSAMAASSLVPSGISSSCSTFLNKIDTDSTLTTCSSALTSATQSFASSSGSASDVQSALSAVCASSVSSACSDSNIRTTLASFYQACTPELTSSPNEQVKLIYDALYIIRPLWTAACSKDDSGAYCGAGSSGASNAQAAQKTLGSTQDGLTTLNADTWSNNNVAFLFLKGPLSSSDCTACTRQVVNAFTQWESAASYAPGYAASLLIKGQTDLYANVTSVCGASFLAGTVNAAGGIGNSIAGKASGAEAVKASGAVSALAAVVFGALALF